MSDFKMPTADEFAAMTADEFELFWKTFEAMKPPSGVYISRTCVRDACILKRAGWKPIPQQENGFLSNWPWRRPPRTKTKPAALFGSMSQAMSELRREENRKSDFVRPFGISLEIDGHQYSGVLPAKSRLQAMHLADCIGAELAEE